MVDPEVPGDGGDGRGRDREAQQQAERFAGTQGPARFPSLRHAWSGNRPVVRIVSFRVHHPRPAADRAAGEPFTEPETRAFPRSTGTGTGSAAQQKPRLTEAQGDRTLDDGSAMST